MPTFGATGRDDKSGFKIRGLSGNRILIRRDPIRVPDSFAFGPLRTAPNPQSTDSDSVLAKLVLHAGEGHRLRLTCEHVARAIATDVRSSRAVPPLGAASKVEGKAASAERRARALIFAATRPKSAQAALAETGKRNTRPASEKSAVSGPGAAMAKAGSEISSPPARLP